MTKLNCLSCCLDSIEAALVGGGIQKALSVASGYPSLNLSLDRSVIDRLQELSFQRESYSRYLALRILALSAKSQDQWLGSEADELINGCLLVGDYSGIEHLRSIGKQSSNSEDSLRAEVIQAYRTYDWNKVVALLDNKKYDLDELGRLHVRALLEKGLLSQAGQLLKKLQANQDQSNRFIPTLSLLLALWSGNRSESIQKRLISHLPGLSQHEVAALLRFIPVLDDCLDSDPYSASDKVYIYRLMVEQLLVPRFNPCLGTTTDDSRSYAATPVASLRCAIVFDHTNAPQPECWQRLANAFADHDLIVTPVIIGCQALQLVQCITIGGKTPRQAHQLLAGMGFDVAIDTIGINNSFSIQLFAQRISRFQLAWLPLYRCLLEAEFYDAWIVDQWTLAQKTEDQPKAYIQLTGSTALALSSDLRRNQGSESDSELIQSNSALGILGAPSQIRDDLPSILKSLIDAHPEQRFTFLDGAWNEPAFIRQWLQSVQLSSHQSLFSCVSLEAFCSLNTETPALCLACWHSPSIKQLITALSCGCIVIQQKTTSLQARSGEAVMHALGLSSFILESPADVVEAVCQLIADRELSMQIKDQIIVNISKSQLIDYASFAKEISKGLRQIL